MNQSQNKPISLYVATPCYGGMVTQEYALSMMSLVHLCFVSNVPLNVRLMGNESLITRGRNHLISSFMASEFENFMFIDADIEFDPADVIKLLKYNEPFVAGAYPLKTEPTKYVLNSLNNEKHEKYDNLVSVKDTGTGFMLIKREVIETMKEAYPELHYETDLDCESFMEINDEKYRDKLKENLFSLFDTMHDKEDKNRYLSEDFTFCKRWKDIGGKIWLDNDINLNHIGRKKYSGDPEKIK